MQRYIIVRKGHVLTDQPSLSHKIVISVNINIPFSKFNTSVYVTYVLMSMYVYNLCLRSRKARYIYIYI